MMVVHFCFASARSSAVHEAQSDDWKSRSPLQKTRLVQLTRRGGMQDRRVAAVVEMDLGERKMKNISKLHQVKLLRNGPTTGVNGDVSETALRVLHSTTAHDLRHQLICCGAQRGKRQIRDNRSVLQGRSAEEENAAKKKRTKGRDHGVCLASSPTSDLQHQCPRRAAAAVPPGEKKLSRRQCTHNRVLHTCLHHSDLQQ